MARVEEDGPRLLSQETFAFELDAELRRAVRSRADVTLVVMEAGRESDASGATVDDTVVREIAGIIGDSVRDTDLVGYADRSALGLVLVDADFDRSAQVLDRLLIRIGQSSFVGALRLAVGFACYPHHGVDARSLTNEAMTHPFLRWQRGGPSAGAN
jgi:PleD family two-component response regulator